MISWRTQILLKKAENKSSTIVVGEIGVNRHTVELWCQKYRNRGVGQTMLDACMKPKDLGYAAETSGASSGIMITGG